jgi:hypothetical protein
LEARKGLELPSPANFLPNIERLFFYSYDILSIKKDPEFLPGVYKVGRIALNLEVFIRTKKLLRPFAVRVNS